MTPPRRTGPRPRARRSPWSPPDPAAPPPGSLRPLEVDVGGVARQHVGRRLEARRARPASGSRAGQCSATGSTTAAKQLDHAGQQWRPGPPPPSQPQQPICGPPPPGARAPGMATPRPPPGPLRRRAVRATPAAPAGLRRPAGPPARSANGLRRVAPWPPRSRRPPPLGRQLGAALGPAAGVLVWVAQAVGDSTGRPARWPISRRVAVAEPRPGPVIARRRRQAPAGHVPAGPAAGSPVARRLASCPACARAALAAPPAAEASPNTQRAKSAQDILAADRLQLVEQVPRIRGHRGQLARRRRGVERLVAIQAGGEAPPGAPDCIGAHRIGQCRGSRPAGRIGVAILLRGRLSRAPADQRERIVRARRASATGSNGGARPARAAALAAATDAKPSRIHRSAASSG